MRNLYLPILIIFTLICWSSTACDSEIKVVKRDLFGTSTLTPFVSKATFTITNTPIILASGGIVQNPSLTPAVEPTSLENISQETGTLQVSSTPTAALTQDKILNTTTAILESTRPHTINNSPEPTATLKKIKPSATTLPPSPTYHSDPPTATAKPTATPIPTETPVPTAAPQPGVCNFSGNAAYENQVIELINQERTDRGLSALVENASLRAAARRHSEDMACNDFFSHTGSDGSTLISRLLDAGYGYSWAAENIAASSSSSFPASAVVSMWMNSPGHRSNILSANAVHIGVGFRYAGDSDSGDYDAYYMADFGHP